MKISVFKTIGLLSAIIIPINVFGQAEEETPCYVPAYQDKNNIVPHPECDDLSGFGGWGTKTINTDLSYVYCGDKSIAVASPWGGTLEINNLQPNTVYRFLARIYVPDGITAKYSAYKHGYGDGDIDIDLWKSEKNDCWDVFDVTYKTSSSTSTGTYYAGDSGTGNIYIDNYEAYIVEEPTIRVEYVDIDGEKLKEDKIINSEWGVDPSKYLMIGHEYIAEYEKQDIIKDNIIYRYDTTCTTDRIIIEEGENVITLRFIQPVEKSDNTDLLSIEIPNSRQMEPSFSSEITEYNVWLVGNTTVQPICTKMESTQVVAGDGIVDLSSGFGRSEIVVTAEDGITTKTYIINYQAIPSDDAFVPTYSDRENLVPNPFCDNLSGFGGWGERTINTDLNYVWSGNSSIALKAKFKGTLEVSLNPNTVYRFIAQTYATKDVIAQFGWYKHGLGSGDVHFNITTQDETWQKADFTLKTSSQGGSVYFVGENNEGGYAYIDNYELYIVEEPTVRIHYVDGEGNKLKDDVIVTGNWTAMDPEQYLMIGHEYVAGETDCASFETNGVYYEFDLESSENSILLEEGENELTLTFKPLVATPVSFSETDEIFDLEQNVYADVTVNRTLKGDVWNTLCLPFDMTSSQLAENGIVEVQKMTGVTVEDNKTILNFTKQDKIECGVPYLVKVNADAQKISVNGVMLKAENPSDLTVTVDNITMHGTYSKISLDSNELFLSNDKFYKADVPVSVLGFRTYITVDEEGGMLVNTLYMDINGEVTTVKNVLESETVDVYTVDGILVKQNVNRINALSGLEKGVYIVDNKKIIKE